MKPKHLFLTLNRRSFLTKALGTAGVSSAAILRLRAAEPPPTRDSGEDYLKELEENERRLRSKVG